MEPVRIALGLVAASALLALAAAAAPLYARLATPGIRAVASFVAARAGWEVRDVTVVTHGEHGARRLELPTLVSPTPAGSAGAAIAVSRIDATGLAAEPLLLVALAALWPAPRAACRWRRLALIMPAALALSAVEQGLALLGGASQAAAELAGDADRLSVLKHWSEFTEAGGSIAVALTAALVLIALTGDRGAQAS